MLPNTTLHKPEVWEVLLDVGISQTALMCQLPRLTGLDLLDDLNVRTEQVCAQLTNPDRLHRACVYPVNVLVAGRVYASGRLIWGSSTWQPSIKVIDALDAVFCATFGAATPSGKRTMLTLDIFGLICSHIAGLPITVHEASTALVLMQLAIEPASAVVGFTNGLMPLDLLPRQRLDDTLRRIGNLLFGGIDCMQPILHVLKRRLEMGTFVIYTDNEAWCGRIHPHQTLVRHRRETGALTKLMAMDMASIGFSIADSDDAGMLGITEFDHAVPNLISEFPYGFQE